MVKHQKPAEKKSKWSKLRVSYMSGDFGCMQKNCKPKLERVGNHIL